MSARVLVVLTSHSELAGEPNGTYMPELTHALHALDEHGIAYDLASPAGGRPPSYGDAADAQTRAMLADPDFAARLASTRTLASVDLDAYSAVYYPGGYGLLFDLVDDPESHRIIAGMIARGRPVAAVCHGPAALLEVLVDGERLLRGREVTGFTRGEEVAMDTLTKIPFLLEDRLLDAGCVVHKRANWQVLVIEDGLVITGQNPASAAGVGAALARRLASN